jgi:hypothetical protein
METDGEVPARRDAVAAGRGGQVADVGAPRAPAIAELCRQHGFRFCDRLHIRLWGDKRGV